MASNESGMDASSACNVARRTARNKMLEVCGTREEKVNATARDMGLVGETEGFDPDPDALLSGTVSSALEAREAALAAVWYDNPATGEALIDQHDGDFSAAMAEAWDVVDGLEPDESDEAAEETDETVEDGLEDVEPETDAQEPETGDESDDSGEEEFVPLEDVGTDEADEADAGDGEVDEGEEEPDEESPEPIEADGGGEIDEEDVSDDEVEETVEEMEAAEEAAGANAE